MTYEQAIEEYEELDADGKSKTLYAHFGLAVYFAQLLEQQAINMIVIKRIADRKVNSQEHLDELWKDYDMGKKTLGSLAKELGKEFGFSPEFILEIEEVVRTRNYLAHDYFRMNSQIVLTDEGKRRMIKDFVEFRHKVKTVDHRLEEILADMHQKLGVTQERLDAEMEAFKKDADRHAKDPNYKTFKK